jgi:transcriptional regulator of arginine metabolism
MRNRVQRQLEIRKIISKGNVHSQEELLSMLKVKGYELTQATLSRDLKFLQVAKVPHPVNGYVYNVPENERNGVSKAEARINYLADGVIDLQFSGNLAVMKTIPGYANSIAVMIDGSNIWEILGTVAGDDTILIILREGVSKSDFRGALFSIIPSLKKRLSK